MLRILIFFLSNLISHINGNHFTFDAVSLITSSDNWLNEEIPCIGDRIRFDNSMPVVAFMDHNVDVESIHLPNNGLIVFTDNGANFGDDVHWQCAKDNLEEPKDVFFTRGNGRDISFYNPKNWIPDRKLFLHMNQVPSEVDDVTVSSMSSAQIYLDLPVKVNTFRFYKREVSLIFHY
ncbi:hypothetical protein GCK72_018985 [Caenorhabditis remanei]|uniref:Protein amnionless n=1 Tax=Caenorhabditis remanei TaxID=31234 RepID=E3M003_CAERE|nr:hypothetical protein GCK72_018985 [Caenorhabditis remanei]EFO87591.1 hypothetical protein CRE_05774 [Caenorhabditis remanei]KAF1752430.1 hypothetical protein GCK72_018985 [Caenorhabditis remanei]